MLNEWERAANGVFHKLYDDRFLYNAYGSAVIDLHTLLLDYIRPRQYENFRLFMQLDRLILGWRIRRTLERNQHSLAQDFDKIRSQYNKLDRARTRKQSQALTPIIQHLHLPKKESSSALADAFRRLHADFDELIYEMEQYANYSNAL